MAPNVEPNFNGESIAISRRRFLAAGLSAATLAGIAAATVSRLDVFGGAEGSTADAYTDPADEPVPTDATVASSETQVSLPDWKARRVTLDEAVETYKPRNERALDSVLWGSDLLTYADTNTKKQAPNSIAFSGSIYDFDKKRYDGVTLEIPADYLEKIDTDVTTIVDMLLEDEGEYKFGTTIDYVVNLFADLNWTSNLGQLTMVRKAESAIINSGSELFMKLYESGLIPTEGTPPQFNPYAVLRYIKDLRAMGAVEPGVSIGFLNAHRTFYAENKLSLDHHYRQFEGAIMVDAIAEDFDAKLAIDQTARDLTGQQVREWLDKQEAVFVDPLQELLILSENPGYYIYSHGGDARPHLGQVYYAIPTNIPSYTIRANSFDLAGHELTHMSSGLTLKRNRQDMSIDDNGNAVITPTDKGVTLQKIGAAVYVDAWHAGLPRWWKPNGDTERTQDAQADVKWSFGGLVMHVWANEAYTESESEQRSLEKRAEVANDTWVVDATRQGVGISLLESLFYDVRVNNAVTTEATNSIETEPLGSLHLDFERYFYAGRREISASQDPNVRGDSEMLAHVARRRFVQGMDRIYGRGFWNRLGIVVEKIGYFQNTGELPKDSQEKFLGLVLQSVIEDRAENNSAVIETQGTIYLPWRTRNAEPAKLGAEKMALGESIYLKTNATINKVLAARDDYEMLASIA